LELAEEKRVVLVAEATQEFETDDQKAGADAARGHHGVVGDVP